MTFTQFKVEHDDEGVKLVTRVLAFWRCQIPFPAKLAFLPSNFFQPASFYLDSRTQKDHPVNEKVSLNKLILMM